jgi:hypothetical protein
MVSNDAQLRNPITGITGCCARVASSHAMTVPPTSVMLLAVACLRRESAMNKIANVENVVCSVETMSRHPELYHYTKPAAFEGIDRSQTLWCSHTAKCSTPMKSG